VLSTCDRKKYATIAKASVRISDQKFLISSSSMFRKRFKPVFQSAFAVVSTHNSALSVRGKLLTVLLMNSYL
jgi:hypothetical protein